MAIRKFDMDSVTKEMGFGKYDYLTLLDVMLKDIDYLAWLKAQPGILFSDTLSEFIREVYKQYDKGRNDRKSILEIYAEYLNKEHDLKTRKKQPSDSTSGLDAKLGLLNSLVAESHKEQQRNEEAQKMWLSIVIGKFEYGDLEEDTRSGKIRWRIEEKRGSDVKRRTVYRADTKKGTIFLRLDSVKKEDDKWYTSAAFLSEDKKISWAITGKDLQLFKALLDEIKKQI